MPKFGRRRDLGGTNQIQFPITKPRDLCPRCRVQYWCFKMVDNHTFLLLLRISHAFEWGCARTRPHSGSNSHLQLAIVYDVGPQSFRRGTRYHWHRKFLGVRKSTEDRVQPPPFPLQMFCLRLGRNTLLREPCGLDAEPFCNWRAKKLE